MAMAEEDSDHVVPQGCRPCTGRTNQSSGTETLLTNQIEAKTKVLDVPFCSALLTLING